MGDLTTLNTQFAISLVIVAIGYLLKRARIVDKEGGGKALVRIIFNVTLPAVILRTLTRIQIDVAMIAMPFLAFLSFRLPGKHCWRVIFRRERDRGYGIPGGHPLTFRFYGPLAGPLAPPHDGEPSSSSS